MRVLIGNKIRLSVEVYDVTNTYPQDPAALFFIMDTLPYTVPAPPAPPYKIEYEYTVDPEIVRDGEGRFHVDVVPDETGTWGYRWYTEEVAPGDIIFAAEESIDILESALE